MTRYVQIDYTLKPDINHGEVKEAIGGFVASIASHHPDHRYTSFQYASDPRRFVHVGEIVEDVVAASRRGHSSGSSLSFCASAALWSRSHVAEPHRVCPVARRPPPIVSNMNYEQDSECSTMSSDRTFVPDEKRQAAASRRF